MRAKALPAAFFEILISSATFATISALVMRAPPLRMSDIYDNQAFGKRLF
jgi:hypothetical protein